MMSYLLFQTRICGEINLILSYAGNTKQTTYSTASFNDFEQVFSDVNKINHFLYSWYSVAPSYKRVSRSQVVSQSIIIFGAENKQVVT